MPDNHYFSLEITAKENIPGTKNCLLLVWELCQKP